MSERSETGSHLGYFWGHFVPAGGAARTSERGGREKGGRRM